VSWVRLDDGFTNHPKIVQLSDSEFRTWIRLLCYCARVEDPSVDLATKREVAGLTSRRVSRFAELGLLDRLDASYEIHDWSTYRKKDETNADRQARWRSRQKNRNAVTSNGDQSLLRNEEQGVNPVTSLARDQARRPVPDPEIQNPGLSLAMEREAIGFQISQSLESAS
jgi:hypothetical protein